MDRWYLLDDDPAPGAVNMARDELLLDRMEERGGAPVLRLYRFDPPAISIGFHQDPAEILDMDAVRDAGMDITRRITGGRALLHENELTYSITAVIGSPFFPGSPGDSFLRIADTLAGALRLLGIEADVSAGRAVERGEALAPPCLASPSRREITVAGRKIIASSQRRMKRAFLQHGSILLGPGSERITAFIGGDRQSLSNHITTVEAELGRATGAARICDALIASFGERFAVEWEPLILSDEELGDASERAAAKRLEFGRYIGTEAAG